MPLADAFLHGHLSIPVDRPWTDLVPVPDYTAGTGQYAEQALRRLAEALVKRRKVAPSG